MTTAKERQAMKTYRAGKRGRAIVARYKKQKPPLFLRVDADTHRRFAALARRYKLTPSALGRVLVENAVAAGGVSL